jgi:hypothetical protein
MFVGNLQQIRYHTLGGSSNEIRTTCIICYPLLTIISRCVLAANRTIDRRFSILDWLDGLRGHGLGVRGHSLWAVPNLFLEEIDPFHDTGQNRNSSIFFWVSVERCVRFWTCYLCCVAGWVSSCNPATHMCAWMLAIRDSP